MADLTLDMIREMPLSVLHSEVARLNEENQRLKASYELVERLEHLLTEVDVKIETDGEGKILLTTYGVDHHGIEHQGDDLSAAIGMARERQRLYTRRMAAGLGGP